MAGRGCTRRVREALVARGRRPRRGSTRRRRPSWPTPGGTWCVATGTASGKSLAYLLPALTAILAAARAARRSAARPSLYLAPTKALAQDQLPRCRRSGCRRPARPPTTATPRARSATGRATTASTSSPTPTCCTARCCPAHARWARFFGSLRYVVVDECHHYRGVFGAHVAQVLRRLRRVCALLRRRPDVRARLGDRRRARRCSRRPADRPRRSSRSPTTAHRAGEVALGAVGAAAHRRTPARTARPVRRSATAEVADLLDRPGRRAASAPWRSSGPGAAPRRWPLTAPALLAEVDPSLADRVAAYRGGYLPEERRELEQALRDGRLLGLAATNALELGIDITGLDAVLLAGFPGTRASLWQQVGRAGRGGQDALGGAGRPRRPARHLPRHTTPRRCSAGRSRPPSSTRTTPTSSARTCARPPQESPLTEDDLALFGPTARDGRRRARPRPGCCGAGRTAGSGPTGERASDLADIRSSGGRPVAARRGRHRPGARHRRRVVAPTRPPTPARSTCTRARPTWSTSLDLDEPRRRSSSRADPDYSTSAREVTDIAILAEREHARLGRGPAVASARSRSRTRSCRTSSAGVPTRRGARRGAARPARAARCAPRRCGGRCPTDGARATPGSPRRTCRAPRTPPSTPRSACCRCSRPATAGTSAASRPPCTPTPAGSPSSSTTATRAAPASPSAASHAARAWLARHPRGDRGLRVRRRLPVVRAVAQVRQRERPARQGRRRRPARRPARHPLAPAEVSLLARRSAGSCAPKCQFLRAEVPVLARRGVGSCDQPTVHTLPLPVPE